MAAELEVAEQTSPLENTTIKAHRGADGSASAEASISADVEVSQPCVRFPKYPELVDSVPPSWRFSLPAVEC